MEKPSDKYHGKDNTMEVAYTGMLISLDGLVLTIILIQYMYFHLKLLNKGLQ